eukprot:CAMPEP_0197022892 /NCGR_PEP_ID=MMETSP1384-20130603/3701_1 /TAXON_ID=29189 /ORGANISM="Ammonia sp." /LENGTH=168 /DNA_ID=CAMNT_0042451013 /DNA_START=57 /DNA_END=563 /DNA_ORIENTATION=+
MSVAYTDCDGVEQTENLNGTQYCCTAENCNHQNIDTSTCSRATEYESLMQEFYECSVDNGLEMECTTETDNVEITCGGIKSLFEGYMGCYCTAYGDIYSQLSSSVNKQRVQEVMDRMSASSAEWNDVFGCDIYWRCNLEKGGVLIDAAANQFAVLAVVWAAIITLMMR